MSKVYVCGQKNEWLVIRKRIELSDFLRKWSHEKVWMLLNLNDIYNN